MNNEVESNNKEKLMNEIDEYVLIKKNYDLNNCIIEMTNHDLEKLSKRRNDIKNQNGRNITSFIINVGTAISLTYISIDIFREEIEYIISNIDVFTNYDNWKYAIVIVAGGIGAIADLVFLATDYSKDELKNIKKNLKRAKKELIELKNEEKELNESLEKARIKIENQYEKLPYDVKENELVKQKMLLLDINKEKETS